MTQVSRVLILLNLNVVVLSTLKAFQSHLFFFLIEKHNLNIYKVRTPSETKQMSKQLNIPTRLTEIPGYCRYFL